MLDRHLKWCSAHTNSLGLPLLESFAALDPVLLNSGKRPMVSRADTSSIIDLTFVNWEASDIYMGSDHATIICSMKARNCPSRFAKTVTGYKIETLDVEIDRYRWYSKTFPQVGQKKNAYIAEKGEEPIQT